MPTRLIIAYSLLALLILAATAAIWRIRHQSPKRMEERRRTRTLEQHSRREERRARAQHPDDAPVA